MLMLYGVLEAILRVTERAKKYIPSGCSQKYIDLIRVNVAEEPKMS